MATGLKTKPLQKPKHERYVEQQLARTEKRIRALDVGSALLWFAVVTLGYALFVTILDRAMGLPASVRLITFLGYLVVGGFFLFLTGLRLYRRINPYFAARQLEHTIPHAKNSLVNWLDLRDEKLPPVIRGALGEQAAEDLQETDAERAVSAHQTLWLAAVLSVLFLGLMIVFVSGPAQFGSLLSRAFIPFRDIARDTRTSIYLVKPSPEGNATVGLNQRVEFQARIEGRIPRVNQEGAPRLHYRYHPQDPYVGLALEEDVEGHWSASLHPDQVQNGFWYKISAGDTETAEYQVRVRSQPQATRFDVTYRYRPYLRAPDYTFQFPNQNAVFPHLRGHRGTEIILVVHTNRTLRDARLLLENGDSKKELVGEILPQDNEAVRFQFVLEKSGFFRLLFTSQEGEENIDRSQYQITVLPDTTPRVELTKPAMDVKLPANGTLQLEGDATDDFGIKSLTLRLKMLHGLSRPALEPKPYRPGKSFQFDDGTYPDRLEYKDFLLLEMIKTAEGQKLPLTAGMVLEYWLEAKDNSDYPAKDGNIGQSPSYKITILEPEKDKKKLQEERQKANQQQQQHEKKQDEDQAKQNAKRKEEQKQKARQDPQKSAQEKSEQQRQQEQLDQKEKELKDQADRLQEEINKQEKDQKNKGEAKGAEGPKGEAKQDKAASGKEKTGEAKGSKADQQQQTGQKKDGGQKKGDQAAQAKNEGKQPEKPPAEQPGQAKKGEQDKREAGPKDDPLNAKTGKQDPSQGTAKDQPKNQPGTAKEHGPKEKGQEQTGQAKGEEPKQQVAKEEKGQAKDPGKNQPQTQSKDKGTSAESAKKDPAQGQPKTAPQQQPAQAKDRGKTDPQTTQGQAKKSEPTPSQERKPGEAKAEEAKGECKNCNNPGAADGQAKAASKEGTSAKSPPPQAASKPGPSQEDKKPGLARGDKGPSQDPGNQTAQRPEPSLDDVTRLQKELQDKNQQGKKDALSELERLSREAKDPKVQQAAKEALKKAQDRPEQVAEKVDPGQKTSPETKPGESPGTAKSQDPGDKGTKEKAQTAKGNGDPKKGDPDKKGGQAGGFGPGAKGMADDPKAQTPDEAAARRGGELSLEELKKKVTPDILKKAGLTEKDWQQFLKDYQAYEAQRQELARQAKEKVNLRGEATLQPGTGLRKIDPSKRGKTDPLQAGQALPPPEFREFHRLFTRNAASPAQPANKK